MNLRFLLTPVLGFSLLLAGCGDSEKTYTPGIEDWERELGAEQHPQLLAQFGGAYESDEAAYLKGIGEKIAGAAGLGGQCTFTLVNTDVVNAFAVPGCYIYVTRGMFGLVNSEAELASVLAHELGHIVADHGERQQRRSLWRNLGVLAVNLVTGSERLTRMAAGAAEFFTLSYSRKQEYESDDLGILYLKQAGYDPHAASDMLGALSRQEQFLQTMRGRDEISSIPEWARTHPLTQNRISRARGRAEATGVAADVLPENEAAYFDTVDGLLYGDDPEQGFVIGRRFAHPVMRIAFEAPEGYTLTNSPRAILIEGPEGVRGEFGGGPMPPGELDQYLSGMIRQIFQGAAAEVGSPWRGRVNNTRAIIVPVRAMTESGAVQLDFAAYDGGGGDAYHFIIISSPGHAFPAAVRELIGSFRLLSAQEAAGLRPRRIAVHKVGSNESLAALADRMATEQPLAHFLMLNGLTEDARPSPGERVKLVVLAPR